MPKRSKYRSYAPQDFDYSQDIKEFGANVRKRREAKGLSLDELSDLIGSDKAALSRIENGERIPRYDTVLKLADALNTTPAELGPDRFSDQCLIPVLPQIYGKLRKLPEEKQQDAVEYINAMLDGLLMRDGIGNTKV